MVAENSFEDGYESKEKTLIIEKFIGCAYRSVEFRLSYRPDFTEDHVRILAMIYGRWREEKRPLTIKGWIREFKRAIEPSRVKSIIQDLYKSGFIHAPTPFIRINEDKLDDYIFIDAVYDALVENR